MAVSAKVSTEPLGEDDLCDILDDLIDVTAQCYQIGTRLRLKNSALTLFRAEKLTHPEALERIINEWLSKNYDVERFGPPTWKALVEAVAHPGGGNHKGLAMEIAKRHQAGVSAPPSKTGSSAPSKPTPPQSALTPQPIVGAKDSNFFRTEADGGGTCTLSGSFPTSPAQSQNKVVKMGDRVAARPGKENNAITHLELSEDLKDLAFRWESLGVRLGYQLSDLAAMRIKVEGHPLSKVEHCFPRVLNAWITGDPEMYTKDVLVKALQGIEFGGLAKEIEDMTEDEFPMDLQSLTKSLKECRASYFRLGVRLDVDYELLTEIETMGGGDAARCLDALLYNFVRNKTPNAEELCDVVKALDRTDISIRLREKYRNRPFGNKKSATNGNATKI